MAEHLTGSECFTEKEKYHIFYLNPNCNYMNE